MSGPAEETFPGVHGRRIFWRSWQPLESPRAIVVIAHGFGEHSGRYLHVADRLVAAGFAVAAPDHHGHGRSEGPRARISLSEAVTDLETLADLALERNPDVPLFLLGHSMGGAIALRYAIDHSDRLTGLLLSGPLAAVEGRDAVKVIGKLIGRFAPGLPLARLDPNQVSRDPAVVAAYIADPLVYHRPIPAGTVAEFLRHVESLPADAAAITAPALIMYGTNDKLAAPSGSVMVSQRIGSTDVTITPYEGLSHEILNEPEQNLVLDEICGWIGVREGVLK